MIFGHIIPYPETRFIIVPSKLDTIYFKINEIKHFF